MDFVTYLGASAGAAVYGLLIAKNSYAPMFLSWVLLSFLSLLPLFKQFTSERKPCCHETRS